MERDPAFPEGSDGTGSTNGVHQPVRQQPARPGVADDLGGPVYRIAIAATGETDVGRKPMECSRIQRGADQPEWQVQPSPKPRIRILSGSAKGSRRAMRMGMDHLL